MLDLAADHLALVKRILHQRIPGVRIWAFGSRVTGHAKRFSDLDLALEGPDELDPHAIFALRDDLSESDLPIRVDVLDLHAVSMEFRRIIERDRIEV